MTGPSGIKVLCRLCEPPRLLCRVIDTPDGPAYWIPGAYAGGWASSPAGVWCSLHGWPDLGDLPPFTPGGKVPVYRPRMLPAPPSPR